MIKNKCPFSAGITVRLDNAADVRFQQESVSAFDKKCCPFSAGIGVRFAQELVSGFSKNMHYGAKCTNKGMQSRVKLVAGHMSGENILKP